MNTHKFIYLILLMVLFVVSSCSDKMGVPPVAWPNETPEIDQPLSIVENIPSETDAGATEQPSADVATQDSEENEVFEPEIKAEPLIIPTADFTNGVATSEIISLIKVAPGQLKQSFQVDIWGAVVGSDIITSPPYIWAEDVDSLKPYIQGISWPDGGLQFKLVAGYSPGIFIIYVSDGSTTLSTTVNVVKR